ncbi:MAG TPA: tetratricopeptide repeat protein [Chryseosolibacter sp.]
MRLEWIEQYMTQAEQLIYNNNVEGGLELLNSLLYEEPGYGRLHNHLGWAYTYYTQDAARAELHLRMAIKFYPEYPAPYVHMGQLLIRLGRYNEAIEFLNTGLTKPECNQFTFLELLGRAYELKAEFRNAIGVYRRAMVASMADHELATLTQGIKRCRRKRWALFFSF